MKDHTQHTSDRILTTLLKEGNESAFRKLFEQYKDDVYRYSLSLLKTQAYAEEIVQEVFLKVWLNRNDIKPELSFRAFLFTITRNLTYNFLNRAANERDLLKEIFYKAQKSANPTAQIMDDADYNDLKNKAINTLPPQRKLIFNKSRLEGCSYEEISSELGISVSTVKNQMSKALSNIRDYLKIHSDVASFILLIFFK